MRTQTFGITDIGLILVNHVLSLAVWMTILHFRVSVLCRKFTAFIKFPNAIRVCRLYLELAMLRIFRRPKLDELDQFVYDPLLSEQRQIRLLSLNPQNPLLNLQARLVYCSLDKAPPYEAISYVWGKETTKEQHIILDGKQFPVSTNVFQILCRRGSLFGSRLIWIDSICINQSDNGEKTEQVRMMKDIYNKAFYVSICLGESPDAWLAWSAIKILVLYKTVLTSGGLADQLFGMTKAKDSNEWLGALLTAFLDLLDHSWFNRVWVVQEVVVARSVSILYGNNKMPWDHFMQVMDILFNPGINGIGPLFQHTGEGSVTRPMPVGAFQAAFMHGHREMFARRESFQLHHTLRIFSAFRATDPRDKIFAILGLTKSTTDLNSITNYETPLSSILVQVANHILEEGYLLEILHFAGIGWDNARTDTPSWVVDWSISRDPVTLAHSFVDDHLQYRAAVKHASDISLGSDKSHIRVRGQFIDSMSKMGSCMKGTDLNELSRPLESVDDSSAWWEEAEEIVNKHAAAPYHNGQDLPQTLWRTVMGDRTATARPAPAAYGANFQQHKQILRTARNLVAKCGPDLDKIRKLPPEIERPLNPFAQQEMRPWLEDMSDFIWLCSTPSFPRKLAITSKGYIAMVPKGTKTTDIICAIWGAQVPFVLRSVGGVSNGEGGKYSLVGECYVHGMMDGECFKLPSKDEMFEIL